MGLLQKVMLVAALAPAALPAVAAGQSTSLIVSAVILSKNSCQFTSTAPALAFGNLDPSSTLDATATASLTFRCTGAAPVATVAFSQNGGLHPRVSNNRMQHTTLAAEFLPYTVALTPASKSVPKNTTQTVVVKGTVKAPDYQKAALGSYRDTLTISLLP